MKLEAEFMPHTKARKVPAVQSASPWTSVPNLIAARARSHPNQIAIAAGSLLLSYAELETQAARLASHLRSLGASPGTLVGLCLERSPQFVVTALAIMKCGAAYLPIDPSLPKERLRYIARDAAASIFVSEQKFAGPFADSGATIVCLDSDKPAIARQPDRFPEIAITPDHLAYVIYTSGSTGEPKGVEITHGNLSNLIDWHVRAFALDASVRATFQAGIGFDAAVWEIWPHLTIGGAIYLPDESTRLSAEALRDWFVAQQITISFVPTAIAEQLIQLSWPDETALRFLLTGADTLHRFPAGHLPFSFVNNYGPTECTVVATSGVIAPVASGTTANREHLPSIGSPIDNVLVHILDDDRREVSAGAIGEIYIGGAGVGRGYRNRPELTAERFIADPFGDEGARLYRTGDLGCFLPNGEIEFLGRVDDQVKIRGYRIELGEINATLREHPSVQASIVIAREDIPAEKRLVAYIVPAKDAQPNEQSLRELVRKKLPDYMEPSAFVWMESLPLTTNGKIDRAALPAPAFEDSSREADFIAPRNPIEEGLAGIIAQVLKVPRVGVHDDFFHLGAHSLLGAQVVAHVRKVFGAELKLLDVFDAPTVAQLSVRIEEALTNQLNAMSDSEVEAALATFNEDARTK